MAIYSNYIFFRSERTTEWIHESQRRLRGHMSFRRFRLLSKKRKSTFKTYSVRFRNFFVQPEFRGKGVASFLMARLAEIGALHHNRLLKTGKKSADILLMFLD